MPSDLEDMMVDRDITYDEARDVLADASDSDEERYERHRERLSDFAEQEREEAGYWTMSDSDLRVAWREISARNLATDYDGSIAESVNFVEDAILQRIDAPDDASGDDPIWQDRIRAWTS